MYINIQISIHRHIYIYTYIYIWVGYGYGWVNGSMSYSFFAARFDPLRDKSSVLRGESDLCDHEHN